MNLQSDVLYFPSIEFKTRGWLKECRVQACFVAFLGNNSRVASTFSTFV